MALQDTDLLPLYRIEDKSNRKISVASFQSFLNNSIPDGDEENYMLIWNGDGWVAGTLDGGLYEGSDIDTVDGGEYSPEVIIDGPTYDSGTYDPLSPGTGDDLVSTIYA
jgi:hypothetical protein